MSLLKNFINPWEGDTGVLDMGVLDDNVITNLVDNREIRNPNKKGKTPYNYTKVNLRDGFSKYKSISGEDIYLPLNVINLKIYGEEAGDKKGTVKEFTIGARKYNIYGKSYYTKTKERGLEKYLNPEVYLIKSQFDMPPDSTINAHYLIKNILVDEIRVIQTVRFTPHEMMVTKGHKLSNGEIGFVDGFATHNGVYVELKSTIPDTINPYYYTDEEHRGKEEIGILHSHHIKKEGKTQIRLHFGDGPNIQKVIENVSFETIIIAKNYMQTGLNLSLGAFTWGWTNKGTKVKTPNFLTLSTISELSLDIINLDYEDYHFIHD